MKEIKESTKQGTLASWFVGCEGPTGPSALFTKASNLLACSTIDLTNDGCDPKVDTHTVESGCGPMQDTPVIDLTSERAVPDGKTSGYGSSKHGSLDDLKHEPLQGFVTAKQVYKLRKPSLHKPSSSKQLPSLNQLSSKHLPAVKQTSFPLSGSLATLPSPQPSSMKNSSPDKFSSSLKEATCSLSFNHPSSSGGLSGQPSSSGEPSNRTSSSREPSNHMSSSGEPSNQPSSSGEPCYQSSSSRQLSSKETLLAGCGVTGADWSVAEQKQVVAKIVVKVLTPYLREKKITDKVLLVTQAVTRLINGDFPITLMYCIPLGSV